jgi:hypothetical protein
MTEDFMLELFLRGEGEEENQANGPT